MPVPFLNLWPDGLLIGAWRRSKIDEKSTSRFYPEIFWTVRMLIGIWRRSKLDEKIPSGF